MRVKDLLEQYQNTPRLFQLADRLSLAQPQKLYLKNLQGSSSQFVVAAAFLHPSCSRLNHLIVLNDAEEAAYFHNTLENLTEALDIFYFPSSFKNRKNFQLLNSSHVMLRTEALTKFISPLSTRGEGPGVRKKIIVTYPEALFEKVVLPETLSSNIIHIKTGDSLNIEKLLLQLSDYGFERTDFVYQPGQFAIRGGILDIYSFGNEKPYRVELFGNDVDSIRIVDPETQLSERKLLQVSIIPNVDTLPMAIGIKNENRISLFDFLPENTVVWMQDYELCKERLEDCEEDLEIFLKIQSELKATASARASADKQSARNKLQDEENDKLEKKEVTINDFIEGRNLEEQLSKKHLVEFGYRSHLSAIEIEFQTKEQPAFNRQFDLLIRDLKSWEGKGFQLFLFAENPKQLERL
ncbi:MAG: transcription-repair coupling factor, partial [Bacteroidota bacterium]